VHGIDRTIYSISEVLAGTIEVSSNNESLSFPFFSKQFITQKVRSHIPEAHVSMYEYILQRHQQ